MKVKYRLHPYAAFPLKVEFRHHTDTVSKLYESNFYIGLHLCITNNHNSVLKWIDKVSDAWPLLLMKYLFNAALLLGECFRERKQCRVKDVINLFDELPIINFNDDYKIYEFRRVVPYFIVDIIEIGSFINTRNKFSNYLEVEDIKLLKKNKWLYPDDLLTVWKLPSLHLSDEAFGYVKDVQVNELKDQIIPFSKRAGKYVELAILAKELNKKNDARELLLKSAENIISYGNHKYMLLHRLIRSIEICGQAGSKKVKLYLRQIAKYVYYIADLTDGDETGSFIYEWGMLMAKFDKNLLYNFYFHSLAVRNYYLSEHLFADILTTVNLSRPVPFAIGNTAVDKNSYNTLTFLSKCDKGASKILQNISNTFGKPDYSENDYSTDYPESRKQKEDPKNYSSTLPKDLSLYLENLKLDNVRSQKYERYNYLYGWAKYWLTRKKLKIEDVLKHLSDIITPQFDQVSDELLMFIYPYAFRVNKNFAFECLVWAQANSSSWSEEYIRNMKYSQEIWAKVIKHYPERIDEFFEKSIINSGKFYHSQGTGQMPVPKATQFFVDAGRLGMAETITEHYINSLDVLFPDVNLPVPDFILNEKKITEFQILMARFEWLSPLVRERAGWHLSVLLEKDHSGIIHKQFFKWLGNVKLESFACNGLLILIKSLQNKKSNSYKFLKKIGVGNLLNLRCRATDLLLMNIAAKVSQDLQIFQPFILVMNYRDADISKEKFCNILGNYLPVIYQDYVERFQRKTNLSVWKMWYNLYKDECEILDLKENSDDRDFQNHRREYMTGRSTIFSEVLKSTFFRLTDHLVELMVLNYNDLFFYTTKSFQVDPSIWNISLTKKPGWWPVLSADSTGTSEFPEQVLQSVKQLISTANKEQLFHLYGQIGDEDKKRENIIDGAIHVLPFAYRLNVKFTPDPSEVYASLSKNMGLWFPMVTTFQNFGFLENELSFSNDNPSYIFNGVEIIPLIGSFSFYNMWQYYRCCHNLKLLTPVLAGDLKLEVKRNKIQYTKNNKVLVFCDDYLFSVKESENFDRIIPAGNSIRIDREFLSEFQKRNNLGIAYVVKINLRSWKYSFSDEYTEQEFYELIK